jgi:hypothetical protein
MTRVDIGFWVKRRVKYWGVHIDHTNAIDGFKQSILIRDVL